MLLERSSVLFPIRTRAISRIKHEIIIPSANPRRYPAPPAVACFALKNIAITRAWRRLARRKGQCAAHAQEKERKRDRVPARKRDLAHPVAFRIRPATPGINLRGLLSATMKIEGVSPSRTLSRPQQRFRAKTRRVADESREGFTDTQPSSDLHFTPCRVVGGGGERRESIPSIAELLTCPRTASRRRDDERETEARITNGTMRLEANARLVCGAKPPGNYARIL